MKIRKVCFAIAMFLAFTSIIGCGSGNKLGNRGTSSVNKKSDSDKLSIVSTIFVPYDFARVITGDKADLTMLLSPGAESHSYEPTPQDIIKIQNCDIFIYVGGESDAWVADVLKDIGNDNIKVMTLMECVDLYEEELVEGMESEEEHGLAADSKEEIEYDEHVWTSPVNAINIVKKMTELICEEDNTNADYYNKNSQEYVAKLQNLDQQFKDVVSKGSRQEVVFGDRFPLRYFVEEYGLDYYAAFPGCSADTEASADTVAFLIDKVKQDRIPVVFYIELSNQKMADTICESTDAKKMCFYTCHNLSKEDFKNGATYLELMTKNVASLEEALN